METHFYNRFYFSSYFYLSTALARVVGGEGTQNAWDKLKVRTIFILKTMIPPFNPQNIGIPVYATLCCILTTTWQDSKSPKIYRKNIEI